MLAVLRKRDFVGWLTGAPRKSRILLGDECSPCTAGAISWGGSPGSPGNRASCSEMNALRAPQARFRGVVHLTRAVLAPPAGSPGNFASGRAAKARAQKAKFPGVPRRRQPRHRMTNFTEIPRS